MKSRCYSQTQYLFVSKLCYYEQISLYNLETLTKKKKEKSALAPSHILPSIISYKF
uniref:Bm685 n=1 Tax=Brugia malayi TaxID=6279 RepID=A0A1I9G4X3_BRUMA|nr:Bm685 [Brugia malayi]